MKRRFSFLQIVLLVIGYCLIGCKIKKHPNILYILVDDMGYGDVSIYNPDSKIKTHYIDQLAQEGMRFTDAHSPSSVCTPTRYALLTGRYAWRSRLPVGVLRGYSRRLIEPSTSTVAQLLHANGYQTAVIGKWHLGLNWALKEGKEALLKDDLYGITQEMNPEDIDFAGMITDGPNSVGFDYSYVLPASLDMPPYCYVENEKLVEIPSDSTPGSSLNSGYTGPFWRGGKVAPRFVFEEVLDHFVKKTSVYFQQVNPEKPFFLYLPLTGPHTPWLPDSSHRGTSKAGQYGDFVQHVDQAVGSVLEQLKKQGLEENTLVVFASDNGPFWRPHHVEEFGHSATRQLRGMKGDVYEGGHRIPFIIRWPGKVKAGSVSDALTTLTNLMATCADIIGDKNVAFKPEDSYSIMKVLQGKETKVSNQSAIIHSASNGFFAIRKDNWKLIEGLGSGGFTEPKSQERSPEGPTGQLFDLGADVGEKNDVYMRYPEKVNELRKELNRIKQINK
jgi:arylsulfatase A-like enzyme